MRRVMRAYPDDRTNVHPRRRSLDLLAIDVPRHGRTRMSFTLDRPGGRVTEIDLATFALRE